MALSGPVESRDAAGVCRFLYYFGRAGCQVADARADSAGADMHYFLLFLLPRYAMVVAYGPYKARTRSSDYGWRHGALEGYRHDGLGGGNGLLAAQGCWGGICLQLRDDAL